MQHLRRYRHTNLTFEKTLTHCINFIIFSDRFNTGDGNMKKLARHAIRIHKTEWAEIRYEIEHLQKR